MTQSDSPRFAYLVLFVSAALQFAAFVAWPGSPDADVAYSIFAAYNFVRSGHLQSINLYQQVTDDLAQYTQIYWMTQWPPAVSWLYALLMWPGLSAGAVTKLLGLLCVLIGGIGWIRLATVLGGSRICAASVAAGYPWIYFMARIYIDFKNDHLACTLVPWVYFGIVQMAPSPAKAGQTRLITTALLAGSTILIKHSLAPVLAATGLYFLWLEARPPTFTAEKMLRVAKFSAGLLLPGALLWLANRVWGRSYPLREGDGVILGPVTFISNITSSTFGAATGWSALLTQLNMALESHLGMSLFPGTIVAVSLILMVIWGGAFLRTKWTAWQPQLHFLQYMCLLTAVLWVFLYAMTVISAIIPNFAGGAINNNFAATSRLYFPIGFGWIVLGAVILGEMPWNLLIRSLRFYSLIVPLLFGFVFYMVAGVFGDRYGTMPNTETFWDYGDYDQDHAAFLSRLKKERGKGPDLVIIDRKFNAMLELGVPVYWQYRWDSDHVFYSSEDLEVWAMIEPDNEKIFLSKFRRASTIEPAAGPPGFPFKFYILRFVTETK
jgi:hypothetical protein